jgi:hypothetical protein
MSAREKADYAKELSQFRELQQSRGFTKGVAKGLTLGLSEKIPGLKPDEEDLMVGLGDIVGSYLPITGLYNIMGKPLVQFAAKSPVAKRGLMSLARLTGFGATGATYKAGKDIVHGEIPTAKELGKEAATWAAIDAALQTIGGGISFGQAVRNIAEKEGVPAKDVLNRLWGATKNFLRKKFIAAEKIGEVEVEVLLNEAKKAEQTGLPKETEIEVTPIQKEPAHAKATIVKEPLASEELAADTELFDQIKDVAVHEKDPLMQAQAQWVVDEMAQTGNDVSKLQQIANNLPLIWKESDGVYYPVEEGEPESVKSTKQASIDQPVKEIEDFGPKSAPISIETFADINRDKFPLVSEAIDTLNEITGKKLGDIDYNQLRALKENLTDYLREPHASPEALQDAIKNFQGTLRFHHPKTKPLKPVMGKRPNPARQIQTTGARDSQNVAKGHSSFESE